MEWINQNLDRIGAALLALMIISVAVKPLLSKVRQHTWLMWIAFVARAAAGLLLGYALFGVMSWLTGLRGAGAILGSIGAIIAVAVGWHAIKMSVAMIRDLADRVPDEDARAAATWIPVLAPAGFQAAWGIVTNPNGLGTGVVAAIMAGISVFYTFSITKAALSSKDHKTAWKWFAALVCLLGGLVLTPLMLFVDGMLAERFPEYIAWIRAGLGVLGLCLAIAALVDVADKVPDKYARTFLRLGLPVLLAFGALGIAALMSGVSNGAELLTGVA